MILVKLYSIKKRMEDTDDLTKIKFTKLTAHDDDVVSNNHIIKKYFGGKLKDKTENYVPQSNTMNKAKLVLKPFLLSSIVVGLFTILPKIKTYFNYSSKPIVNEIIFNILLFVFLFIITIVTLNFN